MAAAMVVMASTAVAAPPYCWRRPRSRAALAQLAHDWGEIAPASQLLLYPMLDDRMVLKRDHEGRGELLWTPAANRLGWTSYLGYAPTLDAAPEYPVPRVVGN